MSKWFWHSPACLPRDWIGRSLLGVLLVALVFGLYGRFAGLGIWPFGVDEFYLSRSVDHILSTGLPEFPCGGFYTRGLSYQYVVALLRLVSGLSPELSSRLVSAVASLAALPAAYLIGRRVGGRTLGLLAIIVLCASVWEIEMARFARMYAPFQSIFLWYVWFFLRYSLDHDKKALVPMIILSVLGALTWEGGLLLGVTNLLPALLNHDRARLRAGAPLFLIGMVIVFVALLAITRSLPSFASASSSAASTLTASAAPAVSASTAAPAAPVSATAAPAAALASAQVHPGAALLTDWSRYRGRVVWIVLFLAGPLALGVASLPWIWSLRSRWMAAVGACVALASALTHQFALCAIACALLLLTGLVTWPEIAQRAVRLFFLALAACLAFWVAFGLLTHGWHEIVLPGTVASSHRWLAVAQHLAGYPDVFGEIVRPWGRTLPLLSTGSAVLLIILGATAVRGPDDRMATVRVILVVLLVLMLAVGASHPVRVETRYTFFLYPLIVVLSLGSILSLSVSRLGRSAATLASGALLCLLFFAVTEDFRPRHVMRIDSRAVNFRIGMSAIDADHYYPRADYRSAALWLKRHAHPGDTVIIGIQSLDQYYHQAQFFYMGADDLRYDEAACRNGTMEIWTNLPLLYTADALAAKVASGRRIFLVLYPEEAQLVLDQGRRRHWMQQVAWTTPGITVALINPS